MAQIHCYVPDQVAEKLRQKAEHAHLSTSKYLAQLIKNEIGTTWPENYFDVFGSWEGEEIQRHQLDKYEHRVELK